MVFRQLVDFSTDKLSFIPFDTEVEGTTSSQIQSSSLDELLEKSNRTPFTANCEHMWLEIQEIQDQRTALKATQKKLERLEFWNNFSAFHSTSSSSSSVKTPAIVHVPHLISKVPPIRFYRTSSNLIGSRQFLLFLSQSEPICSFATVLQTCARVSDLHPW